MNEINDINYGIDKCLNCKRPRCTNCLALERKNLLKTALVKEKKLEEDNARIIAMYREKTPIHEIAKILKHSKRYINSVLLTAGLKTPKSGEEILAERKTILAMFDAGKNVAEISRAVGKNEKTVYSTLHRYGRKYRKGKNGSDQ